MSDEPSKFTDEERRIDLLKRETPPKPEPVDTQLRDFAVKFCVIILPFYIYVYGFNNPFKPPQHWGYLIPMLACSTFLFFQNSKSDSEFSEQIAHLSLIVMFLSMGWPWLHALYVLISFHSQ